MLLAAKQKRMLSIGKVSVLYVVFFVVMFVCYFHHRFQPQSTFDGKRASHWCWVVEYMWLVWLTPSSCETIILINMTPARGGSPNFETDFYFLRIFSKFNLLSIPSDFLCNLFVVLYVAYNHLG